MTQPTAAALTDGGEGEGGLQRLVVHAACQQLEQHHADELRGHRLEQAAVTQGLRGGGGGSSCSQ